MKLFSRLAHDENGGPAAEFALVLPVALLFLAGIIDVGRYMWTYNEAEKATQMGVRYAVATDAVASGLAEYSFAQLRRYTGQPDIDGPVSRNDLPRWRNRGSTLCQLYIPGSEQLYDERHTDDFQCNGLWQYREPYAPVQT